jgi:hypothetical protein
MHLATKSDRSNLFPTIYVDFLIVEKINTAAYIDRSIACPLC